MPTNSLSGGLSLDPHAQGATGSRWGKGREEGCGLLCCVKGGGRVGRQSRKMCPLPSLRALPA